MDILQDYAQLTLPHLAIHNYREEAEQKAVAFFVSLDGAQKDGFFDFLKQVCGEKNSIFQSLQQDFKRLKNEPQRLTRAQKRYILAAVPKFLPPIEKITLMNLEVLENIQKHKLALTRHFTLQPNVQEVIELFVKFQTGLNNLTSHPSLWFFHRQAYQEQERREMTEALVHIFLLRLQVSATHFTQDMQIILARIRQLNHRITYFIEFLGVEVKLKAGAPPLQKKEFPMPALPTFRTELAPYLHEYLACQAENEQYTSSLQNMHESLLAHDLEIALQHYKKSGTLTNIVEISFALRGGAGIVRLVIKSWLSRLLSLDITPREMVGVFVVFAGIMQFFTEEFSWFKALGYFFYPMMIFTLLYYLNRYVRKEEDLSKMEQSDNRERSYRQEMFVQHYEQLLRDKREERKNGQASSFLPDQVENFVLRVLDEEVQFISGHYPSFIIDLFIKQLVFVKSIKLSDVPLLETGEGDMADRAEVLEAVRYVVLRKMQKSNLYFSAIINLMLPHRIIGKYFVNFVGKECAILESFYETRTQKHQQENYFQKYQENLQLLQKRFEEALKMPAPQGIFAEPLTLWLQQEIQTIENNTLERELAQIKEYLRTLKLNMHNPHKVLPLLLEGEEGILYV